MFSAPTYEVTIGGMPRPSVDTELSLRLGREYRRRRSREGWDVLTISTGCHGHLATNSSETGSPPRSKGTREAFPYSPPSRCRFGLSQIGRLSRQEVNRCRKRRHARFNQEIRR